MKRDFMKSNYAAKRAAGRARRRWVMLAVMFVLVIGGCSALFVYIANHQQERFSQFSRKVMGLSHWFADRKTRLQTGLDKKLADIKQVSVKADEDKDLHFEFYTALPAMQISVSRAEADKTTAKTDPNTADKKKPATMLSPMKSLAAK